MSMKDFIRIASALKSNKGNISGNVCVRNGHAYATDGSVGVSLDLTGYGVKHDAFVMSVADFKATSGVGELIQSEDALRLRRAGIEVHVWPDDTFPEMADRKKGVCQGSIDLSRALLAAPAMDRERSSAALSSICLRFDGGVLTSTATDGKVLLSAILTPTPKTWTCGDVLIPRDAVDLLCKLRDDLDSVRLTVSEKLWWLETVAGLTLCGRRTDAKYPAWEKVMRSGPEIGTVGDIGDAAAYVIDGLPKTTSEVVFCDGFAYRLFTENGQRFMKLPITLPKEANGAVGFDARRFVLLRRSLPDTAMLRYTGHNRGLTVEADGVFGLIMPVSLSDPLPGADPVQCPDSAPSVESVRKKPRKATRKKAAPPPNIRNLAKKALKSGTVEAYKAALEEIAGVR